MGGPTKHDAAPAYEELFADHPVNKQPSGSSRAYAPVAQEDVFEPQEAGHVHLGQDIDLEANTPSSSSDATLLQTYPRDRSKPHQHCKDCDEINRRRESHAQDKHYCNMVAVTFILIFFFLVILGIVIAGRVIRK